jgi:hypothetical protein
MKRPWTIGPWPEEVLDEYVQEMLIYNEGGFKEANEKLASRSPEMAELLIELISACNFCQEFIGPVEGRIDTVALRAEELLKEIGYQEEE